ncbi:unnamed protein product, partial [marine sediment metagenome]
LMGGKKKKTTPKEAPLEEEIPETEMDEGDGPPEDGIGSGAVEGERVARGIRKDKMGHRGWQVRLEADGYHAQIMTGTSMHESVADDLGVAATVGAARKLLRDTFNERLLAKWPNAEPINEPKITNIATANRYIAPPQSGGGGGGPGGVEFG